MEVWELVREGARLGEWRVLVDVLALLYIHCSEYWVRGHGTRLGWIGYVR